LLPFKDPEQRKKYNIDYHKKHDKEILRNRRARHFKVINRIKLEVGCEHCGYNENPTALQFHHIDKKTKSFTISANMHWNLLKILRETEKCMVLCANCHAIEEQRMNKNAIY